jgi:ribosomal-protein-alanine N-acetyltransferase
MIGTAASPARAGAALRRRAMGVPDLPRVAAVEQGAYRFPWSLGNFGDSLRSGYLAELLETSSGELVGYFVAMPGVDELHLLNLTVAVPWQGQGHGGGLLGSVVAHAQRLGLSTLWLEVRAGNLRARAIYRRRGFAEVGSRRDYYPAQVQREDAIVMCLHVQGPDARGAAHGLD